MPAYNANVFFAVFFIVYILINTYIFMSVFLAVVYNNYKKYLKVKPPFYPPGHFPFSANSAMCPTHIGSCSVSGMCLSRANVSVTSCVGGSERVCL